MSKRKYRPVKRIESLADFEASTATWYEVPGNGRKMWHRSALLSLQTMTLMNFIARGVYECESVEVK